MSTEQPMTSLSLKEKAVSFLQLVVAGNIREAYQNYIHTDFRHHNPYFRGDRESLMHAMEENEVENPGKIIEVKLAIQENDTVMVYTHLKQKPDDLGYAIVYIFRFKDNQIVEMWDLGQSVPEESPNENGLF